MVAFTEIKDLLDMNLAEIEETRNPHGGRNLVESQSKPERSTKSESSIVRSEERELQGLKALSSLFEAQSRAKKLRSKLQT